MKETGWNYGVDIKIKTPFKMPGAKVNWALSDGQLLAWY